MVFEFIFVTVMFLISIYNLTIAIMGLFPRCRATAVGTLVKSNTRRQLHYRHIITDMFMQPYQKNVKTEK